MSAVEVLIGLLVILAVGWGSSTWWMLKHLSDDLKKLEEEIRRK